MSIYCESLSTGLPCKDSHKTTSESTRHCWLINAPMLGQPAGDFMPSTVTEARTGADWDIYQATMYYLHRSARKELSR